jgi:hypothetical protein
MAALPLIGQHTRKTFGRKPAFICIPITVNGEPGTEIAPFLRPPLVIYGTVLVVWCCGNDGRSTVYPVPNTETAHFLSPMDDLLDGPMLETNVQLFQTVQ